MKAIFIGTVEFSLRALEELIKSDLDLVGVITAETSSINSDFVDLEPICQKHCIPVRKTNNVNSQESLDWISLKKPDVIFCFGWSRLLKKQLLDIPLHGVIGFHPAALPKNRGRHPIIWALFLGLQETGTTFFRMDEFADSGDILSQSIIEIDPADDAGSLYAKIVDTALIQIRSFVPDLISGNASFQNQSDKGSNNWRKRAIPDGRIDFRMSITAIYNQVRALTKPYVGAHIEFKGKAYQVWKVRIERSVEDNIEPGKILKVNESEILVKAYDGGVWLIDYDVSFLPKEGEYILP